MLTIVSDNSDKLLRGLPSVEKLRQNAALAHFPHEVAVEGARRAIAEVREALATGEAASLDLDSLAARAAFLAEERIISTLRPAINATGILLHTNLGRATLAPEAVSAIAAVGASHATLEVDEETGGRGSRQAHCAAMICELTGAEDALVVNNNAAATFLAIAATAAGREVIISRGQLVEIGGQFRLPDVIESAGAKLIEVGTTNRTRIADYERAITDKTALLLRVHPSNYRIIGFTEEATIAEMAALGKRHGLPAHDDIGSGALVDFTPFGLPDEPMAQASIKAGAEVIWFSGDKLIGGPQCGILAGKRVALAPMRNHPLARALRPDKLTLAALSATLRYYIAGNHWQHIPTLRRIARPADNVYAACARVLAKLPEVLAASVSIIETRAEVGGGSLPGQSLSSFALAFALDDVAAFARALRQAETPVYGRIEKGRLLLDLRAVDEDEEAILLKSLLHCFSTR